MADRADGYRPHGRDRLLGMIQDPESKVYPGLARKLVVLLGESRLLASSSVSVQDAFGYCPVEGGDGVLQR